MSYADDYAREEQRLADQVMPEVWRKRADDHQVLPGRPSPRSASRFKEAG